QQKKTTILLSPPSRRGPFFFQAEDGIRDFHVTGVQTCALPISMPTIKKKMAISPSLIQSSTGYLRCTCGVSKPICCASKDSKPRSEERRVGKEGRARLAWVDAKENKKIGCRKGQRAGTRM